MPRMTFEVDYSTHDDLKAGRLAAGTTVVTVDADDEVEADLLAAQIAGSADDGRVVTATRVIAV